MGGKLYEPEGRIERASHDQTYTYMYMNGVEGVA